MHKRQSLPAIKPKRAHLLFAGVWVLLASCTARREAVERTRYFSFYAQGEPCTLADRNACASYFLYGRDTIRYALGNYVWTVTEEEPLVAVIAPGQEQYYALGPTVHVARTDHYDVDVYRKQNVFFGRRQQLRYKVSRPRVPGTGLTGLYIDSLGTNPYGKVSFHMYGQQLSAGQEAKLLKLFDSITFTFTAIHNSCHTAVVD